MNLSERIKNLEERRKAYKARYDGLEKAKDKDGNLTLDASKLSDEDRAFLEKEMAEINAEGAEIEKELQLNQFAADNNELLEKGEFDPVIRPTQHVNKNDIALVGRDGMVITLGEAKKSVGQQFQEKIAGIMAKNDGKAPDITSRNVTKFEFDVDVKTTMTTSAGFGPESTRNGDVVELAHRPPQVVDVLPSRMSGQNSVVFMRATTRTNNAAPVAESNAAPEGALAWTEVVLPHVQVAQFIPATQQQLEDVPGLQALVDDELVSMLREELDDQILNGDGTGANMTGFLNTSGVQTRSQGADTVLDALHKAFTDVADNGKVYADGAMMTPSDWQDFALAKDTNGNYLLGGPALQTSMRVWGRPVYEAQALTAKTVLVGAFQRYSYVSFRTGIEVEVGEQHSDYWVKWMSAIRSRVRAVLVVRRGDAFCDLTLT